MSCYTNCTFFIKCLCPSEWFQISPRANSRFPRSQNSLINSLLLGSRRFRSFWSKAALFSFVADHSHEYPMCGFPGHCHIVPGNLSWGAIGSRGVSLGDGARTHVGGGLERSDALSMPLIPDMARTREGSPRVMHHLGAQDRRCRGNPARGPQCDGFAGRSTSEHTRGDRERPPRID